MFVGREAELRELMNQLEETGHAVLIYGKRKIGKTRLIKEAFLCRETAYTNVYYECIKDSEEANVKSLINILVNSNIMPEIPFARFTELFAYLNTLPVKINIAIDEYPYLKTIEESSLIDSEMQKIIDEHLSNINLILSGSHIGIMKEMMEEGNALYGRFSRIIALKELDYIAASEFYKNKTVYEKIAFYAVFGGSPYINKQINPDISLRDNIISTILNSGSAAFAYADNLLLTDLKNSVNASRILSVIGNGKKRYSELENILKLNNNGNLSKQLKTLTEMETISVNYPINKPDDRKKRTYFTEDGFLKFYYCFIYKNKSALEMLGAESFYENIVLPGLNDFIARRFEEICRMWFSLLAKNNLLSGIQNIGTYYYDDPVNKKNGEFDVALKFADGYEIYEVKYHSSPLEEDEINRELSQISSITELDIRKSGFISVNGFTGGKHSTRFITGEDIYKINLPEN